jgi:hypothetical protein
MRNLLIAFTILFTLQSSTVSAGTGPRYRVEFHDPVRGAEGVFILDVIFSQKAGPYDAERILRREIDRMLHIHRPNGDILANAWYSPTGREIDEDLIVLPDGSPHLIYLHKVKRTITFKEYERRKPR